MSKTPPLTTSDIQNNPQTGALTMIRASHKLLGFQSNKITKSIKGPNQLMLRLCKDSRWGYWLE